MEDRVSEVSVEVRLNVMVRSGQDPVALERAIASEGRRAARELYLQVIKAKDEAAVEAARGSRQRREPRWVATLFGRVRIHRYRVKQEAKSFHPLDEVLDLHRAESSLALRALAKKLADRMSYRDIAMALSQISGEPVTYHQVGRLLRDERH
jgi:hypothetical protein